MQPKPITVTQLTQGIKSLLEENLGRVILRGEISNLARPGSGHLYFNVKDDRSQISGVMFRSTVQRNRFFLENGLEVVLYGRITVYEPRGVYQLIVDRAEPLGAGALQLAFEQMKTRLTAEGLFDSERKQSLPFLPKGIGVVTSPTGAVVRDILNILERRFPAIPVVINPVSVQGDTAAGEIASAIKQFQGMENIDLLIVGRGGGSIEDLWAFNEEVVARAIFKSRIPVISAVGHETDFTIADFVADLRAPTPSAAAELAVPLQEELKERVESSLERLAAALVQRLQSERERLNHFRNRLRSPQWVIQHHMQRVDELSGRISGLVQGRLQLAASRHENLSQQLIFYSPRSKIEGSGTQVRELEQRLIHQFSLSLEKSRNRLQKAVHVLNTASPLSIMNRGYAIVKDGDGRSLKSVSTVKPDDRFSVRVSDGSIQARVEKVTPSRRGSTQKKEP